MDGTESGSRFYRTKKDCAEHQDNQQKSCIRAMPDYVSTFRIKQEQEKNRLPMCLRITVMFRSVENKDSLG